MIVIALFSLIAILHEKGVSSHSFSEGESQWDRDEEFLQNFGNIGCDIRRYDQLTDKFDFSQPFVASGHLESWFANERWKKENFLDLYGSKTIRIGSESSIVYAGGNAGIRVPIEDLLSQMSHNQTIKGDMPFVFDTTILTTIPSLRLDFNIPKLFSNWDTYYNEQKNQVWHMLSLGPSRSGLPTHNHGQTWLAIVHGSKRWFIYPPGYGAPPEVEEQFNPLLSVNEWLTSTYPLLNDYPKPPLRENAFGRSNVTGYKPLECMQMPGDVLYIPAKWSHMTVNIGETIALGGQEKSFDDIRESLTMLAKYPNNYELNKDMGLAQNNQGHVIRNYFEGLFGTSRKGSYVTVKSSKSLYDHLRISKDTWLIFYYHRGVYKDFMKGDSQTLRRQLAIMDALAKRFFGVINVGVIDLSEKFSLDDFENFPIKVEGEVSHYDYPFIKVHRGAHTSMTFDSSFEIDKVGMLYPGDVNDAVSIASFMENGLRIDNLCKGSIFTATCAGQSYYKSGISYLQTALKAKPFHPETTNALCTTYATMYDYTSLHQCVKNATVLFERFNVEGVSKIALSTVFQRLGKIYMNKFMYRDALPLIAQSLQHNPECPQCLLDHVVIHLELRNKAKAKEALSVFISHVRTGDSLNEEIPSLVKAVESMP